MHLTTSALAVAACAGLVACSAGGGRTPEAAPGAKVFAGPAALASASNPQPDGLMWLVAGPATSRALYKLNLIAGKITGSTPLASGATSVAETLGGQVLVGVGGKVGALELHDPVSGALSIAIPMSGPASEIVPSSDGRTAYVLQTVGSAKSIAVIDLASQKTTATLPADADTVAIAALPDGSAVLALGPTGTVAEISTSGGKVTTHFGTGTGTATAMALSPDGTKAYVERSVGTTTNVAEVLLATESVTQVLPSANDAVGLAISADGHTLYVAVGTPTLGNVQSMSV